jgi:hypothetical protein
MIETACCTERAVLAQVAIDQFLIRRFLLPDRNVWELAL